MFMRFFTELKAAKVPVTLKEYLMLMEGMDRSVIDRRVEDFYYLSRAVLVLSLIHIWSGCPSSARPGAVRGP